MVAFLFASFISVTSIQSSIAQLQTKAEDEQATLQTHCSAVVLDGRNFLLTEEHCILADKEMFVDGLPVKVVAQQNGLAVLEPRGRSSRWRGVRLREHPLAIGQQVFAAGHAYGSFFSVTTGRVAGFNEWEGIYLWMDLEVIAGMSGGAIVDSDGRLVSLVRMSRPDGPFSPNGLAGSADPRHVREIVAAASRARGKR